MAAHQEGGTQNAEEIVLTGNPYAEVVARWPDGVTWQAPGLMERDFQQQSQASAPGHSCHVTTSISLWNKSMHSIRQETHATVS